MTALKCCVTEGAALTPSRQFFFLNYTNRSVKRIKPFPVFHYSMALSLFAAVTHCCRKTHIAAAKRRGVSSKNTGEPSQLTINCFVTKYSL